LAINADGIGGLLVPRLEYEFDQRAVNFVYVILAILAAFGAWNFLS
jgi:hypothetical protein